MKPEIQMEVFNKKQCPCCSGQSSPAKNTRLRYWEVDHFFKCPVVGMCLTLVEQKQILKKIGPKVKKKSPFELHELLVGSAETENRISRRIDTLLNRKAGKAAEQLLQLEPEAFVKRCLEDFKAGEYTAGIWATAIHPSLHVKYRKAVFGEVHMTMHWSGEEGIRMKRKLALKQAEVEKAQQASQEALRARRDLEREDRALQDEVAGLKAVLAGMQKEKEGLEKALDRARVSDLEAQACILRNTVGEQAEMNTRLQYRINALEEENCGLAKACDRHRETARQFKREARSVLGEFFAVNRCDETCPSFDLCKKRVLIVGGIERMEALYRDLIERQGGVFEYHDGYMRKGTRGLEGRLKRADVVLCPVNCNSHAACSAVKNLAKKHNKKVHMLASFSLNTVTRVLADGGSGRGTINGTINRDACRN